MDDHEDFVLQTKNNALAKPADAGDLLPDSLPDRRVNGTKEKRARDLNILNRLPDYPWFEGVNVGSDVRQFRHPVIVTNSGTQSRPGGDPSPASRFRPEPRFQLRLALICVRHFLRPW